MVNQVRMLGGKWSIKISHSASPRNRSSRNSRSPAATASVTAGVVAGALSMPAATAGPARGSATDVICQHFERDVSSSPKTASGYKLQALRMARHGELTANHVQTTVEERVGSQGGIRY